MCKETDIPQPEEKPKINEIPKPINNENKIESSKKEISPPKIVNIEVPKPKIENKNNNEYSESYYSYTDVEEYVYYSEDEKVKPSNIDIPLVPSNVTPSEVKNSYYSSSSSTSDPSD